jgi:drug/metabolite transporter (DMT)-like permease
MINKGSTVSINNYTYLAFIIAFIWGISPVLYKFFLEKSTPTYIIIFLQSFIYLITTVLYILIWKRDKFGSDLHEYKNYLPFILIISFFAVYVANYLYIFGIENKGNVNIMSIVIGLAPVVTILFSYFIFRETLSLKAFIGFFIIVIGLLLIFTG